jgi:hypothetical protein
MIKQIAPVPSVTTLMSSFNRDLVRARHIQARLKSLETSDAKPQSGILWDPAGAAPYLVPITRWIE